jgi:hypothetical protein
MKQYYAIQWAVHDDDDDADDDDDDDDDNDDSENNNTSTRIMMPMMTTTKRHLLVVFCRFLLHQLSVYMYSVIRFAYKSTYTHAFSDSLSLPRPFQIPLTKEDGESEIQVEDGESEIQ